MAKLVKKFRLRVALAFALWFVVFAVALGSRALAHGYAFCYCIPDEVSELGHSFSFNAGRRMAHQKWAVNRPGVESFVFAGLSGFTGVHRTNRVRQLIGTNDCALVVTASSRLLGEDPAAAHALTREWSNVTFILNDREFLAWALQRTRLNVTNVRFLPTDWTAAFYIAGAIAATMTPVDKPALGFVTAADVPANATRTGGAVLSNGVACNIDHANAFVLGARQRRPEIKVHIARVTDQTTDLGRQAALSLVARGCGVVAHDVGSTLAIGRAVGERAARTAPRWSISFGVSGESFVGDTSAASLTIDWEGVLLKHLDEFVFQRQPTINWSNTRNCDLRAPCWIGVGSGVTVTPHRRFAPATTTRDAAGSANLTQVIDDVTTQLWNMTSTNPEDGPVFSPAWCNTACFLSRFNTTPLLETSGNLVDHHELLPASSCPAGMFAFSETEPAIRLVCFPCPPDTYSPTAGMVACLRCSEGTVPSLDRTRCDTRVLLAPVFICLLTFAVMAIPVGIVGVLPAFRRWRTAHRQSSDHPLRTRSFVADNGGAQSPPRGIDMSLRSSQNASMNDRVGGDSGRRRIWIVFVSVDPASFVVGEKTTFSVFGVSTTMSPAETAWNVATAKALHRFITGIADGCNVGAVRVKRRREAQSAAAATATTAVATALRDETEIKSAVMHSLEQAETDLGAALGNGYGKALAVFPQTWCITSHSALDIMAFLSTLDDAWPRRPGAKVVAPAFAAAAKGAVGNCGNSSGPPTPIARVSTVVQGATVRTGSGVVAAGDIEPPSEIGAAHPPLSPQPNGDSEGGSLGARSNRSTRSMRSNRSNVSFRASVALPGASNSVSGNVPMVVPTVSASGVVVPGGASASAPTTTVTASSTATSLVDCGLVVTLHSCFLGARPSVVGVDDAPSEAACHVEMIALSPDLQEAVAFHVRAAREEHLLSRNSSACHIDTLDVRRDGRSSQRLMMVMSHATESVLSYDLHRTAECEGGAAAPPYLVRSIELDDVQFGLTVSAYRVSFVRPLLEPSTAAHLIESLLSVPPFYSDETLLESLQTAWGLHSSERKTVRRTAVAIAKQLLQGRETTVVASHGHRKQQAMRSS